jgi:pyrrolidone-carboxylate peptidase
VVADRVGFMILIYAFSNQWGTNISHRTLLELQKIYQNYPIEFRLIYFHPQQFFQKYIARNQYDLIIGLGDMYTDFSKIRIETQAKNAYNNQPIYPFSPILLDLSLPNLDNFDSQYFVISSSMGTYNCNWMAYSTQLHIDQKQLNTKQIFLHLPKKSNATFLANQIKNLLQINNLMI